MRTHSKSDHDVTFLLPTEQILNINKEERKPYRDVKLEELSMFIVEGVKLDSCLLPE